MRLQTDAGWTPLHEAAVNGRSETLTKLLDLGAKLQATTTDGDTALHKAARWGHAAAVQLLLRRGADVHARDKVSMRLRCMHASDNAVHADCLLMRVCSNDGSSKQLCKHDMVAEQTARHAVLCL